MLEAIGDIFKYENNDQLIAIILLLAITFFIGVLLYGLFIHLPKARKAKKNIQSLEVKNKSLEKDNKNLTDKLAVQEQKLIRLKEEHTTQGKQLQQAQQLANNLQTQNTTLSKDLKNQQRETQNIGNELQELKRQYKYAQAEIQTAKLEVKDALKAQEKAEKENNETLIKHEQLQKEIRQLKRKIHTLTDDYQQLSSHHKDLKAAQEEFKAELQRVRQRLENSEKLNDELEEEHRQLVKDKQRLTQIVNEYERDIKQVQHQLQSTKHTKDSIAKQLETYTQQELAKEKAKKQEEQRFQSTLDLAAEALQNAMLYHPEGRHTDDFIEHPQRLEQRLEQEKREQEAARLIPQTPAQRATEIAIEEHEELETALRLAKNALQLNGFYNKIDKSILIKPKKEPITDDDLLNKLLEEAAKVIHTTDGYFKHFDKHDWIADKTLWQTKIQQTNVVLAAPKENTTTLTAEEHQLFDKLLDMANKSLQNEGFYTDIHPTRLIEVTHITEPIDLTQDPKYKTEIERSVVAEIGKTVPMMNEIAKDDLKKIDGINEFIEQKLYHLGIYTYEQICYFTPDFIQKLTAAIGFADKTIQQHQWMNKARDLYKQKNNIN